MIAAAACMHCILQARSTEDRQVTGSMATLAFAIRQITGDSSCGLAQTSAQSKGLGIVARTL